MENIDMKKWILVDVHTGKRKESTYAESRRILKSSLSNSFMWHGSVCIVFVHNWKEVL